VSLGVQIGLMTLHPLDVMTYEPADIEPYVV
jgi:hypothetical protein